MLVVFDGRAQSVPLWLAASGFVLWEGVKIAGAQYRIPYVYKVSERLRVGGGVCCMRGLGNGCVSTNPCGMVSMHAHADWTVKMLQVQQCFASVSRPIFF